MAAKRNVEVNDQVDDAYLANLGLHSGEENGQ
jgi:hypothetical protein